MDKFILDVIHEETIPESGLLEVMGGGDLPSCNGAQLCNIYCPSLCPSLGMGCKDKLPGCLTQSGT